jgi:hypothetical protein
MIVGWVTLCVKMELFAIEINATALLENGKSTPLI